MAAALGAALKTMTVAVRLPLGSIRTKVVAGVRAAVPEAHQALVTHLRTTAPPAVVTTSPRASAPAWEKAVGRPATAPR